jgi:hypothetical protein
MKWADDSRYEGEFENSFITGKGIYYWGDGRIFSGNWLENRMHGYGTFLWPDGKKYEGNYINDKKHGYGKYYWTNEVYYEGNWINAKQHGIGICHTNDIIIKAEFRCGRMVRIISEEKLNENEKFNENEEKEIGSNILQNEIMNKMKIFNPIGGGGHAQNLYAGIVFEIEDENFGKNNDK